MLHSDLYAVAALLGAAAVVVGHLLRLPNTLVILIALASCFGLRLLAIRRRIQLPRAHSDE